MFFNKFIAILFFSKSTLNAAAIDSVVISSWVGPIPPEVKTYVNFLLNSKTVLIIVFLSSSITLASLDECLSDLIHLLSN